MLDFCVRYGILDWGATLAALTSTVFLLRKSILFWIIGPVANLLWLLLFAVQGHYLAAGLQLSYIIFSLYAIFRWIMQERGRSVPAVLEHTGTGIILAIFLVTALNTRFTTSSAYLEFTAVTLFLIANWLTARKWIACWYCWIAANSVFAVFLWQQQILGTFLAQFVFIGLSLWGLRNWRKERDGTTDGPDTHR